MSRGKVLRAVLLDPYRAYYQRQLETVTGLPLRAVQRELERLSAAGLLYRRAEGNRAYYQADPDYVFYPELRGMILKTATALEALRAMLAVASGVRLAFRSGEGGQVLAVLHPDGANHVQVPAPYTVETVSSADFLAGLAEASGRWDVFLSSGTDLLGRREDAIWGRIEAAGYTVNKEQGVP